MKRSKEATRPGNKARGSLVSLTINTKTRPPPSQHPNRTTKTGSTRAKEDRSARPSSSSFGRTHSKQKQIQIPAHRRPLQPEEADCAKAIWDAMGKFPHLSRRMPSLRPRSGEDVHQQWELQYPPWRYFNFTGSWDLLKLSKECLRRLCDRLIDDMSQIHDAHVAYVPDVRTLCVVEPRAGADWRPILDGFNFTICPDDELVCWSELKANTIATARAQFAVLELLTHVSQPQEPRPVHVELDPDILARILEHDHTHPGRYSYIISQVQRYSPDLGAFVAKSAYRHICQLSSPLYQSRAHYATETEQVSSTLEYIMMLLEGSKTTTASNSYENAESPESQTVYVALHVVRASLLILLHRCTVENPTQRGLLDLYSCDETADAYTSEKGFSTVRYARDKARLAVESFEGGGGRLGGQTAYLILGRT